MPAAKQQQAPSAAAPRSAAAAAAAAMAAPPAQPLPSPRWLWARAAAGAVVAAALAGLALLAAGALALTALLPAYLAAELAFAAHFFRRRARLSALPGPGRAHEPAGHDGDAVFERFMAIADDVRLSTGIDGLLRCWYGRDTPFSEIRRGNAAELLVYGFHYRTQAQMAALGKAGTGEAMLRRLERAWDFVFQEGHNPSIELMTHLWEPIKAHWRPLAFYAVMEAFAAAKHGAMLSAGWACARAPGGATYYTYGLPATTAAADAGARLHDAAARGASAEGRRRWSARLSGGGKAGGATRRRPAAAGSSKSAAAARQEQQHEQQQQQWEDDERSQVPILFCHGVGLGLAPYVPLVQRLAATGRPVIAVEFKHLAMRWTRRVPTVDEVADSLVALLAALGVERCDAVGHSFGTFYLSRLLRTRPDLVRTASLLDPVCCCMWTGDLISNFVYRPHASRTGLTTWLIARDLHTAASVSRNFFWSDYNLWPDALPARSLLAVGERDDLVPIAHVASTVAADRHSGGRVTLVSHPDRAHADVVFDPRWQERVVGEVVGLMAAADADDAAAAAVGDDGGRRHAAASAAAMAACLPAAVPADVLLLQQQQQQQRSSSGPPSPLSPSCGKQQRQQQRQQQQPGVAAAALDRLRPRSAAAAAAPPLSIGSPSSPRTPAVEVLLPSPLLAPSSAGARSPSPPATAAGGALAAFAASAAAAPQALPPSRSASAAAALRCSGTSTTSAWAAASYAPPTTASITRQASLASGAGEALAPADEVVAELRGFGGGGASRAGSGGAPSSVLSLSCGGSEGGASDEGGDAVAGAGKAGKGGSKRGAVPLLGGGEQQQLAAEPAAVKRALSSLVAARRQQQEQLLQEQSPGSP
jgi:pimeloyl-ACP methyl ester carboxylesterase